MKRRMRRDAGTSPRAAGSRTVLYARGIETLSFQALASGWTILCVGHITKLFPTVTVRTRLEHRSTRQHHQAAANFMQFLIQNLPTNYLQSAGSLLSLLSSCSHYARLSYQIHGFWKGTILTVALAATQPLDRRRRGLPRFAVPGPTLSHPVPLPPAYGIFPNEDLVAADTVSSPETRVRGLAGELKTAKPPPLCPSGPRRESRHPKSPN